MYMTTHAASRVQQRAIPPAIVSWLHQFGSVEYSGGARKLFFDKAARKRLAREIGPQVVDRLGDLLNVYIVVDNAERLITAAHRLQRIKRH